MLTSLTPLMMPTPLTRRRQRLYMSVWQVILDLAEIFPGESLVDTDDDGFAAAH
jgi:hypothetical protein